MTATRALFLVAAFALPARAATVNLLVYDQKGRELGLPGLIARLARADDKSPDPGSLPFWAFPLDKKSPPVRAELAQIDNRLTAAWPGGPARLELVWPVKDDGYSEVSADNDDHGFADGATVALNEEIARTEYRLFKNSLERPAASGKPPYALGADASEFAERAQEAMADAAREKAPAKRGAAFEDALRETSLAWRQALYERGLQSGAVQPQSGKEPAGLTLDDSFIKRVGGAEAISKAASRTGSNWVKLVFRQNLPDFSYASPRSFDEYDAILAALRKRRIKVLAGLLDAARWPKKITPEAYSERVKNIVQHCKSKVDAWEVGSEINGDWLGGADDPLSSDQVYKIYSAGAAMAKKIDPSAETVATLYWWEATAPDRGHSLSGWLGHYAPKGFGSTADVVGLDLYPEENPVGLAFERAFETVADALPGKKTMLSGFGYVEKDALQGYWWLDPRDVNGARKDLRAYYPIEACAMRGSVCGGFWWQAAALKTP